MQNRWLSRPFVHLPEDHGEKKASWLELFFDLIFVASFIQLGNLLSSHVNGLGVATFAGCFTVLWMIWTCFAWLMNRFTIDDAIHRLMTFALMFVVGATSLTTSALLEGDGWRFAVCAGAGFLIVSLINLRLYIQTPDSRPFSKYWGTVIGVVSMLFFISAPFSIAVQIVIWTIGTFAIVGSAWTERADEITRLVPGDEEHFSERYALLTLIVLGESFVKILSDLATGELAGFTILFEACFVLLITCSVWWIYFDDVAGSERKERPFAIVQWMMGHLPLQMGVIALAVGLKKAVHFDLMSAPPLTYRWLLCGGLAATFLAVSLIDSVTERRESELDDRLRVNIRFVSAGIIVLLGAAGSSMTSLVFLGLLLLVCVAQVILDIFAAPTKMNHEEAAGMSLQDRMKLQKSSDANVPSEKKFSAGDAVRKGMPNQFRRDLYAFFMTGSWKQLFLLLGIGFFLVNIMFACLYMLRPGSVEGVAANDFWGAFHFSVQTISTIGYGALSPLTSYGNFIVTIEAMTGLLITALATGIMFAKASRPHATIMFSEPVIFGKRDGQLTMQIRTANARGHEVVDATITATALIDHVTEEGEHLRQLHELALVRERTPYFMLSWTVMHVH